MLALQVRLPGPSCLTYGSSDVYQYGRRVASYGLPPLVFARASPDLPGCSMCDWSPLQLYGAYILSAAFASICPPSAFL